MTENLAIKKSDSWKMFDKISPKYDFLNHFLSFGFDISWRKKLTTFLPKDGEIVVLDLATGTADVLITVCKTAPNVKKAFGIDLADKMLNIGRTKVKKENLQDKITLQHGDANEIPFDNETFDVATMAFGIRNVEDPMIVLQEIYRTLNKEGQALILEFSLPQNFLLRACHLFYLKIGVPLIGGLISGNYSAYRYLNKTIEKFPYGEQFFGLMREAGFRDVKGHPLLFGIATIYHGKK